MTLYNGEACVNTARKGIYRFVCSDEVIGPITVTEPAQCTYQFQIPTKYACDIGPPPPPSSNCGIGKYNFSSLTSKDGYKVIDERNDYLYLFNICDEVNVEDNCRRFKGIACQYTENGEYISYLSSYTNVTQWSYIENGVRAYYDNGLTCGNNGPSRKVAFDFVCGPNESINPSSIQVIEMPSCFYTFTIPIKLAC